MAELPFAPSLVRVSTSACRRCRLSFCVGHGDITPVFSMFHLPCSCFLCYCSFLNHSFNGFNLVSALITNFYKLNAVLRAHSLQGALAHTKHLSCIVIGQHRLQSLTRQVLLKCHFCQSHVLDYFCQLFCQLLKAALSIVITSILIPFEMLYNSLFLFLGGKINHLRNTRLTTH